MKCVSTLELINNTWIRTDGEPLDIAVKRNYAFVATGFWGVATVNISELEKVDNIDLPGDGVAVECVDNTLYVVESEFMNSSGLHIFDVSNSLNPLNRGTLEFRHSLEDIYVEDNHAFLVGNAGLEVINVSDSETPEIVGHYRFPGWNTYEPGFMKGVHVEGNMVYVADQSSFKIFRFNDPLKVEENTKALPQCFRILQNYPNPFNSSTTVLYTLGKAGWVTADIYDPAGRLVENLIHGYQTRGLNLLQIYADNLATGTYLVRFETSEGIQTLEIQNIK
ncbi:MAG: T9SS type A sorting domain-containing protein [Calditrichaeota bacterium]|nr:T9SS type A sorting domain-containing protein [Calditrichota bacterium]